MNTILLTLSLYCAINSQAPVEVKLQKNQGYYTGQFYDFGLVANKKDKMILIQSETAEAEGQSAAGLYQGFGTARLEVRCAFKKFKTK